MPFNEGQLKAIQQRDASILVSAPAGSGKTRILVSRIVELLKEGYNINEFLVLTFTEAAGNEMKQRLSEELNELVSLDIDASMRQHLQLQILNLPHAYITNFHGFCNQLLMKYGYMVNVMPGFSINSDPSSIKREVLDECIEKWIQDNNTKEMISLYFPGYSIDAFKDILLSIDELSHSIDHFYDFVEDMHQKYYDSLKTGINDWSLLYDLKTIFFKEILQSKDKLTELLCYCEDNELTDFYERPMEQSPRNESLMIPYESYFDYLDERLDALTRPITFDTMVSLLKQPLEKSYNMSWKEVDPDLRGPFNKMKNDILSSYKSAVSTYLPEDEKDFISKMNISYELIHLLMSKGQLLDQFQQAYQLKKKELNQLDFSDLEQFTHQLLEPQYGIVSKLYYSLKEIMVDEYQDTNQIQESLLLKISKYNEPSIPLFMVGDMKQSIYRFRQADPFIFSHKYNTFSLTDEDTQKTNTKRIDLVFNYRSSKVVLDSINYIFNQIMDKEIGGLEYYLDDSARLNYDYDGKESGHQNEARQRFFNQRDLETEVLIDLYSPDSDLSKDEYEAHMVAQRIMKLKESSIDGKSVNFKDIAVLMRSTTAFLTFKKVFDRYHIPNHIVLSQGLMSSNEIITMIAFMKAISNPYDDVSMLSVLTSPYPFSHISSEVLAHVRMNHKDISLYETLKLSDDSSIIHFLEVFEEIRNYSYNHSPYELLKYIYEKTSYVLFVSQLINGAQRKANLLLLLEIVQQFQENTPYLKDLIVSLDETSDFAPALASSGDDNAVEFMTIHKSKGLEFPIVFVCQTHKQFNTQDSKERLIIDKQFGFAIKPRIRKDTDDIKDIIVEYDNPYHSVLARKQTDASINEEMRILYVALTRASSKLILTGVIKSMDEIVDIQRKLLVNDNENITHRNGSGRVLLYNRLRKTNNYLSWILSGILRHSDIINQCKYIPTLKEYALKLEDCHFEKDLLTDSTEHSMFSLKLTKDVDIEEYIPPLYKEETSIDSSIQVRYLNHQYPYDLEKEKTMSVTALQKLSEDHFVILDDKETSSMKATDKGTLVHLLLSYLSFKDDDIDSLIHQLFDEELIDEEGVEVLNNYKDELNGFIQDPYYQMICESEHIYREKYFSYYDQDRDQIIHGIFDLVFIHNNQVYVLDYKTDRVSKDNTEEALIESHEIQLEYYKKVLKEMYHQDIKAVVYYLHISKGVEF